uniref:ABC transporter permease n=1 Tax=Ndongobacter massiliensis TaxID=1871025 RepID=UPI000AA436DA|nr:ABC transporter permease subunit [Ndongobacter massiliensis]
MNRKDAALKSAKAQTTVQKSRRSLPPFFGGLGWILLWAIAARAMNNPVFFPGPIAVFRRFFSLLGEPSFSSILCASTMRILLGFLLGQALGVGLAIPAAHFSWLEHLLTPPLLLLRSAPVASLVLFALFWVSGRALGVLLVLAMVLPIFYNTLLEGLRAVDPALLEMGHVFRVRKTHLIRGIYVPQIFPYYQAAAQIAMGLSWKVGTAAEVIGQIRGSIGAQLYQSKIYLELTDLCAWTLWILVSAYVWGTLNRLLLSHLKSRLQRFS